MTDRHIFYIVDKQDGSGPKLAVLPPRASGDYHEYPIDRLAISRLNFECAEYLRKCAEWECQMSGQVPDTDPEC